MWSQIDVDRHVENVKESESLVVATTESAEVEARKLKNELATSARLLSETHEELLEQNALAEKHWEEGKKALEELRSRLTADYENELEDTHKEFQAQPDAICK